MLNSITLYRLSRWMYVHHIPLLPHLLMLVIFLVYNSKIPYKAHIGKGTYCGYSGIGVVIHSDAYIGENCVIGQHVTIGGGNSRYPGVPVIGDNVFISHGAIIFGGITIGDNVIIGANAVVNIPIPDNAVVAGVPAKILRIRSNDES